MTKTEFPSTPHGQGKPLPPLLFPQPVTRCLFCEGRGQGQWQQCSPTPSPESPRGWELADSSPQNVVNVALSAFSCTGKSPTQRPPPKREKELKVDKSCAGQD